MWRSRWAAVGAAVAIALGGGGVGFVGAAVSSGEKPVTVLLDSPCRLRDTRPAFTVGGRTTPLGVGEAYTVQGTGPSGDCNVPADAVGLVTNVTAIGPSTATDLRLYASGGSIPETSNLNPVPGQPPTPNAVTVGLSPSGKFVILNKFGHVHVIIDVVGYLVDHNHDDLYYRKSQTYTKAEVDALLAQKVTKPTEIVLPAAAFSLAQDATPSMTYRTDFGSWTAADMADIGDCVVAPVTLPVGATVTGFRAVYYYNSGASDQFTARLYRFPYQSGSPASEMAAVVEDTPGSAGGRNTNETTIANAVVTADTHYYVQVCPTNSAEFEYVKITFTNP